MYSINQFSIEDHFDFDSVKKIIGESKQVSVYGWSHCYYETIGKVFSNHLEKVFNYRLGSCYNSGRTLEGREIEKIKIPWDPDYPVREFRRKCRHGITNLLLENYKRYKECRDIIPLVFCIDIDENKFTTNSETISSKDEKFNNKITHAELRHCYKLHCEFANSSHIEFQEMSYIAKKMFKFVKLTTKNNKVILQEVPALWDWAGLSQAMKERAEKKANRKAGLEQPLWPVVGTADDPWRIQLLIAAKRFGS